MDKVREKAFKLDLVELHATCEANYARLIRLFPDYENANQREFSVGASSVTISVIERSRFTTIFRLNQQHGGGRWPDTLRMELRAYHDAGMLEVGLFQSQRADLGRYRYPNRRMYQQDEKTQQNRFLAEWLEHSLRNGCARPDQPISLTGS